MKEFQSLRSLTEKLNSSNTKYKMICCDVDDVLFDWSGAFMTHMEGRPLLLDTRLHNEIRAFNVDHMKDLLPIPGAHELLGSMIGHQESADFEYQIHFISACGKDLYDVRFGQLEDLMNESGFGSDNFYLTLTNSSLEKSKVILDTYGFEMSKDILFIDDNLSVISDVLLNTQCQLAWVPRNFLRNRLIEP